MRASKTILLTILIALSFCFVSVRNVDANDFRLKRRTFGGPVGKKMVWDVLNHSNTDNTSYKLMGKNLHDGKTLNENVAVTNNEISYTFKEGDEGIWEITLVNDDKKTDPLLQIVGPKKPEIGDENYSDFIDDFIDTETEEKKINQDEYKCKPGSDIVYDVIVVGGTSAGIGAAYTAAKENLKTCLMEPTSLLGGMFTNGIGKSDIGLDKFGDLGIVRDKNGKLKYERLSFGVMDELRKKVLELYLDKEGKSDWSELSEEQKKYIKFGLVYRPSLIRKALYQLMLEGLDNGLSISLKTYFKEASKIDGQPHNFEVKAKTEGESDDKTYYAKYIIDATDCGDVAASLNADILNSENDKIQSYNFVMTVKDYNYDNNEDCSTLKLSNGYIDLGQIFEKGCVKIDGVCVPIDKESVKYKEKLKDISKPDESVDHWSRMHIKPSCYGKEGEYTDESLRISWTFASGQLAPNVFQIKHHMSGDFYEYKGETYWKLGDELPDRCDQIRNGDDDCHSGYAFKANDDERYDIRERYFEHAISFLYHMQTIDPSIGLTEYEDPERGNFPARIYIREGRRIKGKYKFEGNDACKNWDELKKKIANNNNLSEFCGKLGECTSESKCADTEWQRPIQPLNKTRQSIGVVNYSMDIHSNSKEKECEFSDEDSQIVYRRWHVCAKKNEYLRPYTGPGVIPLGIMIPVDNNNEPINNLIVPLAVSATERGYSTLRLDPVRSIMGQAAALAIKTVKEANPKITLAQLLEEKNEGTLFEMQRKLIEKYNGKIYLFRDEELVRNSDDYDEDYVDEYYDKDFDTTMQFLGIYQIAKGFQDSEQDNDNENEEEDEEEKKRHYKYLPKKTISRAEVLKMALIASPVHGNEESDYFNYEYERNCPKAPCTTYPDIGDEWFKNYVYYATDKGIVNGYSNGKFEPDQDIIRAEAAKIITNAIIEEPDNIPECSEDVSKSEWYCKYILWLKKYLNKENEYFDPGEKAKRKTIADDLYNAFIEKKGFSINK